MRRGGWRKRASEDDGFGAWGGYMAAKVQKLEEQFQSDAPKQQQKDGTSSALFSGVAIVVNGYTDPSADELRRLMMLHGGQFHRYYSRSKTTHIIASNLPNSKIQELKGEKVVRPEWILESIKAGRLLSYIPYQLYTKQSHAQKVLNFNTVCKPEDTLAGPSAVAVELNNRVNHTTSKHCVPENDQVNGIGIWKRKEAMEEDVEDFDFTESGQTFSGRKQNGVQHHQDSTAILNGHTHSSHGALKSQDCLLPSSNCGASRLCLCPMQQKEGQAGDKGAVDLRDCSMQQSQHSNKHTDILWNPHRTVTHMSSSLHSSTKLNGAHHSIVQGPSNTKSTSVPSPCKALLRTTDPSFISDFYSHSRLHHISTWKCEFTEFVRSLQRKGDGIFPGREKLKRLKAGKFAM